jgi:hypothetical protein
MKQKCTHNREDLVLHYYNETDLSDSAEVTARLEVCPACKEYYASLGNMELFVPRAPSLEPDDAVMSAIRAATTSRLREVTSGTHAKTRSATQRVQLTIFKRLSVAASVLMLVFIGGRLTSGSGDFYQGEGEENALASISDVRYDEATGLINVHYRTEGQRVVSGMVGDLEIQTMLGMALSEDGNPAARLRATKLLAQVDMGSIEPNAEFVMALERILQDDQNVGMQLHAVKALQKVHGTRELPESLSLTLMDMLETSPNSALRIDILELLTQSEVARQELATIFERASTDENSFIRNRAKNGLNDMDQSVALEELN